MTRSIPPGLSRALVLAVLAVGSTGFSSVTPAKSPSLSCRVHEQQIQGATKASRTTDFVWSAANGTEEATGPIKTSIGRIDQAASRGRVTVLTLNSKPISLPAALAGVIVRQGLRLWREGRVGLHGRTGGRQLCEPEPGRGAAGQRRRRA
jgi:hypothetical protein